MEEIGSNVTFPLTKSSTQCSLSISSPSRTGKKEEERNKALTGKQRESDGGKKERTCHSRNRDKLRPDGPLRLVTGTPDPVVFTITSVCLTRTE